MKTYKTTSASKLVARFEDELLDILFKDLRNFRVKNSTKQINQQVTKQQTLSAA